MSIYVIRADFDKPSGTVAIWIREHAARLSIGLVIFGIGVSTLGFLDLIPRMETYLLRTALGVFTVGTIVVGFEIVAFAEISAKDGERATVTGSLHEAEDCSDDKL